ncbi:MAG: putative Fe-S cluster assembly protein SufT [Acidobacteria bacterium]|nr:MAG: putative Fe-S cluster assembly protein SufT [Acidobacteriota bacterium]
MNLREPITLSRACEAIEIPSGIRNTIPAGSTVRVMQSLGTSYTVATDRGYMFRIDAKDRDALGISPGAATDEFAVKGTFSEQLIKDELRTVFDPEIPVNVLDLGLIYSCAITPLQEGGNRLELKMSMTAPGCGMGNVLKADVENKLSRLPEVKEVHVEIVFDPPWHPGFMSESAKLQLGFDLDAGQNEPGPSVFR